MENFSEKNFQKEKNSDKNKNHKKIFILKKYI